MHKKIRAGTYKPESKVDVIGEKNVTWENDERGSL
jgi:hypothetical protein